MKIDIHPFGEDSPRLAAGRVQCISRIALDILNGIPLRDKAAIADLEKRDVPYLQYAFDKFVGENDEMGKDVMHRIWKVFQETYRAR